MSYDAYDYGDTYDRYDDPNATGSVDHDPYDDSEENWPCAVYRPIETELDDDDACYCESCQSPATDCTLCKQCGMCIRGLCVCEKRSETTKEAAIIKKKNTDASEKARKEAIIQEKKMIESPTKKNPKQNECIGKYVDGDLNNHDVKLGALKVQLDALEEKMVAFSRYQEASERRLTEMDKKLQASVKEMSEQNEHHRLEIAALVDPPNEKKRKRDDGEIALDGPTRECSSCKLHKPVSSYGQGKNVNTPVRKVCGSCRNKEYRNSKKASVI